MSRPLLPFDSSKCHSAELYRSQIKVALKAMGKKEKEKMEALCPSGESLCDYESTNPAQMVGEGERDGPIERHSKATEKVASRLQKHSTRGCVNHP